jgi:hypothetical protein
VLALSRDANIPVHFVHGTKGCIILYLATSRRKIALSALWSTVLGDAKPAGDDRRGLPSVAMLE